MSLLIWQVQFFSSVLIQAFSIDDVGDETRSYIRYRTDFSWNRAGRLTHFYSEELRNRTGAPVLILSPFSKIIFCPNSTLLSTLR